MTLPIYRLRRWLAGLAILFSLVVAGMYLSARRRQHSLLKDVPGLIGIDIKQTAKGFQFSKSDGGRTLFTIQASNLKQFKLNGRAELQNVSIVLYGRDSSRFDQITGDTFLYDPKTGDVTASGEVQIDLGANPSGLNSPDQSAPSAPANPIHLKTRDLVFNKETGNAYTTARAEFQTPQAAGSAVGVQYAGRTNSLILSSQIHLVMTGSDSAVIDASHAVVTNEPRQISLDHPHLKRDGNSLQADAATIVLSPDNSVEHVFAQGSVIAQGREESKSRTAAGSRIPSPARQILSQLRATANAGEMSLGNSNRLHTAVLSGDVRFERTGTQPMQGDAGRVTFDFAGQNQIRTVHADQGVKLTQLAPPADSKAKNSTPKNFDLTAPAIDFFVAKGRFLHRAVTSGNGQITISAAENSAPSKSPQRTIITAGKFDASFDQTPDGPSRLASIHGAPGARIVSSTVGPADRGQADRISTSDAVDAEFLAQGGIDSITQQGHVVYTDGSSPGKQTQAWADRARYTPADQVLTLSGNPRITQPSMTTTATTIRINRGTGEASAEGEVKSTYSQMKEQRQGALLASGSPIHITAAHMIAQGKPAVAIYTGNARLWQDANIIEAPSIQFDRDCRCVNAAGNTKQPVATTIVQAQKAQSPRSAPIFLSGLQLTYDDDTRKVHYDGGVSAKGPDFTASAKTMDLYLKPRSDTAPHSDAQAPAQLDRFVARDDVILQQPGRRAVGQTLTYEVADDKFILAGGPPSIFDAEHGKITGVSLTFFRRDDRVLVEGKASTPVVTQTRVAR